MPRKRNTDETAPRWYRGTDVPMRVIRQFARAVAERFQPDKIILFGSHAYGTPHDDSDVDILVVTACRNPIDQACRIDRAFDPPFPLDLIVRSPNALSMRLKEGDSFLREIVTKGKILYEAPNRGVGQKGRGRLPLRPPAGAKGRTIS